MRLAMPAVLTRRRTICQALVRVETLAVELPPPLKEPLARELTCPPQTATTRQTELRQSCDWLLPPAHRDASHRRSTVGPDHNQLSWGRINRSVDAKLLALLHLFADERAQVYREEDGNSRPMTPSRVLQCAVQGKFDHAVALLGHRHRRLKYA